TLVATLSDIVIVSSITSLRERASSSSCFRTPPPATRSPGGGSRTVSVRCASPRATSSRTAQQRLTLITDAVGNVSSARRPTSSPSSSRTAWKPSRPENDSSSAAIRSSNGSSGRGEIGTWSRALAIDLPADRRDRADGRDDEHDADELTETRPLAEEGRRDEHGDRRELCGEDAGHGDRAAVRCGDEGQVGGRVAEPPRGDAPG